MSWLFIRSVPMPVARAALRHIRNEYPDATITVLTSPSGAVPLDETGAVDEIQTYRPRRFGLVAAGPRLLLALRRRHFDRVIVPFTGRHWRPCWNVGRLALAIGWHTAVWLPCDAPAGAIDLERCTPIWRGPWQSSLRGLTRLRHRVLSTLRWPLICVCYVVTLALLVGLAAVLVPLVWLTPNPRGPACPGTGIG